MTHEFEIFLTQELMDTKTVAIDGLLKYPNVAVKTTAYRAGMKKYQGTDWAATIDHKLVEECEGMTPEERLVYYDDSDLKSYQWLVDNNWFEPY